MVDSEESEISRVPDCGVYRSSGDHAAVNNGSTFRRQDLAQRKLLAAEQAIDQRQLDRAVSAMSRNRTICWRVRQSLTD